MSQGVDCRSRKPGGARSSMTSGGHRLTKVIAARLGISVRQAYRITASLEHTVDRRHECQALLARYILLEVHDPAYAAAMTDFLDDLVHTLLEHTSSVSPDMLDQRWAKQAARQMARSLIEAAARREQRLNDLLENL